MQKSAFFSLLVVVVLSLGLAACGGGGDEVTNAPASGGSPQLTWDQGNWGQKNWQ